MLSLALQVAHFNAEDGSPGGSKKANINSHVYTCIFLIVGKVTA